MEIEVDTTVTVDLGEFHEDIMEYASDYISTPEPDREWSELADAYQIQGRDRFIEMAEEKLTKRLNRVVKL